MNSCELELFLAIAQPSRADALISSGYFHPLCTNRCVRFSFCGFKWLDVVCKCRVTRQLVLKWQSQIASFNSSMPYFGHMAYFVIGELHDINVIGSNLFASR